MAKTGNRWGRDLERMFLQYGAGSSVYLRFTRSRLWNVVAWILIVMGILLWVVMFWVLRGVEAGGGK